VPFAPEPAVVRFDGVLLDAVLLDAVPDAAAFEAVLLRNGFLATADFDPAACVFAFFVGVLAGRDAFLGSPAGGVWSGAVTRAS